MKNIILHEPLTRVWQKWRFYAPQTHLWLIKVWFYASTFVVKIATFFRGKRFCYFYFGKFSNSLDKNKVLEFEKHLADKNMDYVFAFGFLAAGLWLYFSRRKNYR
ncbi:MAG: hypothetical protein IPI10_18715 [Bacteroidetes bacterium]|nr:hypothetical protein [Bacteroidota bacterium]